MDFVFLLIIFSTLVLGWALYFALQLSPILVVLGIGLLLFGSKNGEVHRRVLAWQILAIGLCGCLASWQHLVGFAPSIFDSLH